MLQLMYFAEMAKDRQRTALKTAELARLAESAKAHGSRQPIRRPGHTLSLVRKASVATEPPDAYLEEAPCA